MRRSLQLALLVLGTLLAARHAGAVATIDLAWDNCAFDNTPSPSASALFACDGSRDASHPYRLFATMHAPRGGYPGLTALTAEFDLLDQSGPLPAFWAFEDGGCNLAHLSVETTRPAFCGTAANNTWGAPPGEIALTLSYTRSGNRAYLEVVIATLPTRALNLISDADYHLFQLVLNEDSFVDSPPGCAGCGAEVEVCLKSVKLESGLPGVDPMSVTQSGIFGTGVGVNGASPFSCYGTPTENRTWGALKSLYR